METKESGRIGQERAVHDVRVTEIPKPRWTAYDANVFKVKIPVDVLGPRLHLADLVHAITFSEEFTP